MLQHTATFYITANLKLCCKIWGRPTYGCDNQVFILLAIQCELSIGVNEHAMRWTGMYIHALYYVLCSRMNNNIWSCGETPDRELL